MKEDDMQMQICRCGHKRWEHQPECIHSIHYGTRRKSWANREYCKCKKFEEMKEE